MSAPCGAEQLAAEQRGRRRGVRRTLSKRLQPVIPPFSSANTTPPDSPAVAVISCPREKRVWCDAIMMIVLISQEGYGRGKKRKNAPLKENLKQVRTEIERDTLSVKVCVFIHDRCESWRLQCAPTATTHSRVVYCSTDPSESRTETTEHPPHRCRRYITTVENTMQQTVLWKCEETILFAFKWFTRRHPLTQPGSWDRIPPPCAIKGSLVMCL